ncbi:hypothetical protein RCO48_19500 [Peribacillus frigoritolerans]|nr:hypothetical protein [Peribacillus frigoritolerans]
MIDAGVHLSNDEVIGKDALPDYLKRHNVKMKEESLKRYCGGNRKEGNRESVKKV